MYFRFYLVPHLSWSNSVNYVYFFINTFDILLGKNIILRRLFSLVIYLQFDWAKYILCFVFLYFVFLYFCLVIYLQFDWAKYNPETAERLILMDKDQAAQKLHFVSAHFVLKANMEICICSFFLHLKYISDSQNFTSHILYQDLMVINDKSMLFFPQY